MDPLTFANSFQAYFAPYSDSSNAVRMSKYMLNKFEFFGIPSPLRKQLTSAFIAENGLPAPEQLEETVKLIWQKPQRELHYAIMEIASRKVFLNYPKGIGLYEFMITTNSWWDTVDFIAANLVGAWLLKHKEETQIITLRFMQSGNIWLQRTALLFQLKYRANTDHELLFNYILQLKDSKEFFIRKAIGWSLREFSKTDPEKVIEFTNSTDLSPLSRREALKIILKNKK